MTNTTTKTSPNIKRLVTSALLAAMTCIATMIIKIPTPTFGYIHLGDSFVLLCGFILGPYNGAIAAGIGSMFSDIFSGYASWAPATLVIKALTAYVAGSLFRKSGQLIRDKKGQHLTILLSGIAGETIMVLGYFIYEIALTALSSGTLNEATLAAGITSSATGIPFNIVQGTAGIFLSILLLPMLRKIPDIRQMIDSN